MVASKTRRTRFGARTATEQCRTVEQACSEGVALLMPLRAQFEMLSKDSARPPSGLLA